MIGRVGLDVALIGVFGAVLFIGHGLAETGSALPLLVGYLGLALSAWQLLVDLRHEMGEEQASFARGDWRQLAWFALLLLTVLAFGFLPAAPLWMFLYLRLGRRESWPISMGLALGVLALLWGGFGGLLGVSLFEGLIRT